MGIEDLWHRDLDLSVHLCIMFYIINMKCLSPVYGLFSPICSVARGLRPANGILQRRWTLQLSRMQWSRFIWIMLVIW